MPSCGSLMQISCWLVSEALVQSSTVDWFQTDQDYVLKADLPGDGKNNVQVYAENGKVVEISGQWKQQGGESKSTKDWRSGNWWEHGYVREA
ncbi:hypothetical protein GBA52_014009 [Prunus armeniaca]|nr:hypothetical protein GBA52_014009 [Prunus armeniaca]